jgi:amino acid adenylation domain-containing protein
MVCLTALFTLLYRYAGEEELVVGTPVAGRPFPELEGIVGFFANTILLRASMGGQPSFRSLLRHVRTNCLAAFDHQEVPLESLLLSTTPDGRPLAVVPQVVFSMEDPDKAAFALAGTAARPMAAALGGSKFDLHLWAAERAEGLRLSLEYRTALYDEGSVTRFLSHFGALLAGAVAEPDAPISALPLMDDAERTQVVRTWNATAVDYPAGDTLVSLLEAQAARTPDAPAVRDARTTLSYAQLHAAADALAARLRAAGAGAGTRVGICAERSVELVVALVATLKAGAAYVPFDPEYPRDRLAFMVADAAVAVVIAPAAFVPLVASGAGAPPVVALEGVAEPASAGARTWPAPTPDDAAYMIYTSGSTGRPKGAVNAHRHIVNRLRWMQATFQLTERDVVLQKTPMSFDVSVWEFFWPLLAGARLVLAAPGGHRDPAYLADVIRTEQVSVLHFVPSMLRAFLAAGVAPAAGRTLRAIMASGEALPADLVAQCQAALPQAAVHNLYGPTECAVDVTWWPCPPGLAPSAVVPIGRPIANTQCYVLDAHGAPCPIGVPGELYLAGAQVGLGYHGRAELTAERFVADPFAAARGARMYRTGDRARWRADGTIEYLGRLDFQVKLRGFRIELGEIEAALQGAGGVRESVVVMHGSGADARLVAYVVPSGPGTADPARLAAALGGTLPAYMVPAVIMPLDAMPLTPSGKVDRRALPAPKAAATARRYVAPRTTIEHELAQCWEAIVQPGHPVSAFDDFFEIGGNSLLAIRMLAQVERLRGQRVPLAWLLEGPTVAALATRLAAPMHDAAEPPLVTLNPEGTGRPLAWVHGDWTGGGWYLRRLAPLVVPDAPVHVFPTLGQEDDDAPWTIEAMAARHVGELRKVQPNGPYTVVGFCVGGVVAFEMARQLREAGETVDRLVVIDSDPMNGRLGRLRPLRQLVEALPASSEAARLDRAAAFLSAVRWVHRRILYYQSLPAHERRAWLTGKVTRRLPWNRPVAARPAASAPATPSPAPATPAGATPDDDAIVLRSQGRATAVYIPGRWDGALDFVWAEGAPGKARRVNPVERWRRVAREVHLHRVPSGHIGLNTNTLALLADALRALVGRR